MSESQEGVIGYFGDRHGRPAASGNDHLTAAQRDELSRQAEDQARHRGRLQAVVVVDVYENGEAVPQVQFPKGSTIDMWDRAQVNASVAKAAEALQNWG
jgi:hypothetical protein